MYIYIHTYSGYTFCRSNLESEINYDVYGGLRLTWSWFIHGWLIRRKNTTQFMTHSETQKVTNITYICIYIYHI